MRLTFLGHAAVRLEIGDHDVLVDPFLTDNPQAAAAAEDLAPTHILLTHGHRDHVGDAVDLARRTGAPVVSTVEVADWLERQGVEDTIGMNVGGGTDLPFGRVSLTPAWHTSGLPDGSYGGIATGVLVEAEDRRVYHAGDTALFGDMSLIGRDGLDLALLPIGDFYTMGPRDAAHAARLLRAERVVPIHYDTFPPIRQDAEAFRALVGTDTDARCEILAPGQSLTL